MKKLLLIAAAILSLSAANAQVAYVGYQNVPGTRKVTVANTTTATNYSNSGFFLGGAMNFEIADALGIQPGLEVSYFGRTDETLLGDDKFSMWGINIPIDVNYGFDCHLISSSMYMQDLLFT